MVRLLLAPGRLGGLPLVGWAAEARLRRRGGQVLALELLLAQVGFGEVTVHFLKIDENLQFFRVVMQECVEIIVAVQVAFGEWAAGFQGLGIGESEHFLALDQNLLLLRHHKVLHGFPLLLVHH